ncbi:hypothetical protein [Candidatus Pyrohabitans sp.]
MLIKELEGYIKRKNKVVWSLYWSMTATVGMLIMLMPVNLVVNREGTLATWFILYVAFAAIALISYGAILKGRMNVSDPIPVQRKISQPVLGEVHSINLPSEDIELLYSLKELEEWFRRSSVQNFKNPAIAAKEIERWYRLGVLKEINIRNMRRRIKELERELKSTKKEVEILRMEHPVNQVSVQREGIKIDA